MCRLTDVFDPANDEINCDCRNAVECAYQGLLKAGEPETIAMQAAKRVYRFHHPEDSIHDTDIIVERWVTGAIH
jgi:hypothetical protein